MLYLHLLLIAFIAAFIVDYSGAVRELRAWLNTRVLHREEDARLRPFDCSLCVTFWTGLIYVAAVGSLSVPAVAGVCLAAWLARFINNLLFICEELFNKMLNNE